MLLGQASLRFHSPSLTLLGSFCISFMTAEISSSMFEFLSSRQYIAIRDFSVSAGAKSCVSFDSAVAPPQPFRPFDHDLNQR